jgi:RNA polymerase sigma factor (TIGR02999 family)
MFSRNDSRGWSCPAKRSFKRTNLAPYPPTADKFRKAEIAQSRDDIIDFMTDVTQILSRIESGDPTAAEQLLPLIYNELRHLAAQKLTQEKPGQTLQATALVHEAYLRLVDGDQAKHWNSRGHFFGAAAEAMRRILVDQARHKRSQRRGGDYQRIELSVAERVVGANPFDMLALDEALNRLAVRDPRAAELVKLRFFAGLTVPEAAKALVVSVATAENDWAYARSWLKLQLSTNDGERT